MSATTVPAVEEALESLFKAAVEEPTEVWGARPSEDHQLAENVYIEGARGQRKFVSFPANSLKSRQEDYQVQVTVEVYREGTDSPGAKGRMWEIVAQLEASIATNPPSIGGSSFDKWGLAASFQQENETQPEGLVARYVFGVEVSARI